MVIIPSYSDKQQTYLSNKVCRFEYHRVVNLSSSLMITHTALIWKVYTPSTLNKRRHFSFFSVKILTLYACFKFREIGHINLGLKPKYLYHIKYICYRQLSCKILIWRVRLLFSSSTGLIVSCGLTIISHGNTKVL